MMESPKQERIDTNGRKSAGPRTLKLLQDHLCYYADDPAHILVQVAGKYVEARFTKDPELLKAGLDPDSEMPLIARYRRVLSQFEAGDVSEELAARAIREIFPQLPANGLISEPSRKKHDSAQGSAQNKPIGNGTSKQEIVKSDRETEGSNEVLSIQGTFTSFLPDVEWAVETMKRFQELKRRLLEKSDVVLKGDREYPKKSGCRKYALAFRLSLQTLRIEHELVDGEKVARVWIRATAPDGVYVDGYGVCDSSTVEKSKMDPSWHNIESKAQTRSYNRAILDLVGGGEVSAEEID